jgi:hypothetical protein
MLMFHVRQVPASGSSGGANAGGVGTQSPGAEGGDPCRDRDAFSFSHETVPANRVAVPAP